MAIIYNPDCIPLVYLEDHIIENLNNLKAIKITLAHISFGKLATIFDRYICDIIEIPDQDDKINIISEIGSKTKNIETFNTILQYAGMNNIHQLMIALRSNRYFWIY